MEEIKERWEKEIKNFQVEVPHQREDSIHFKKHRS